MTRCPKRFAAIISVMALLLALLNSCSSAYGNELIQEYDVETDDTAGDTVVTFFGYKADAVNLISIENALCRFMNDNPDIYVTYEGIKGQAYWDAFDLRQATGHLDDIIMIDHDHIVSMGANGDLADLSDISTLDNYLPWAADQFTEDDGSIYFLPTCVSSYNLYINTDLLEENGQEVPENLAQFTAVCDYFVSRGVTPIIANNYASLYTVVMGAGMYDVYRSEDSSAIIEKFNSGELDLAEQLRPGIEFVEDMRDRGWIDCQETLVTEQTSDDLELFAAGDRPFMISGGWASIRLDVDFDYGVYPYPILEDGSVLLMNVDTCIGINVNSEHIAEAKKLIEFLTQPEVLGYYCSSQCSYSPLIDESVPSEQTIVPSVPYLTNGRHVLRVDYDLNLPVETSMRECCTQILQGLDTDGAVSLLRTLLYGKAQEGTAP